MGKGDRVLIYMPMMPEAVFAMLATVRIGAIHSVVFGGFAAASLAARIDDAQPKVMVTSDAGIAHGQGHRAEAAGRRIDPPVEVAAEARGHREPRPRHGDDARRRARPRLRASCARSTSDARCRSTWLESNEPSYILYTSGTTGKPKGVQRDTGGYAVALAASMQHIYCSKPGEAYFCTSDIGWVVGHSYIVYGPLINGSTTIMYEGVPIRPDAGIWWKIVQDYKVTSMFSSPTAIRVLKKQDPAFMKKYDTSTPAATCSSPASRSTSRPRAGWRTRSAAAIVDNYWQTETGWPILSACPGVEDTPRKFGSPSFAAYGYHVKLKHEETGKEVGPEREGRAVHRAAAAAGRHDHHLGRRRALREDLFRHVRGRDGLLDLRLGRRATRTATTSCSAAPTT